MGSVPRRLWLSPAMGHATSLAPAVACGSARTLLTWAMGPGPSSGATRYLSVLSSPLVFRLGRSRSHFITRLADMCQLHWPVIGQQTDASDQRAVAGFLAGPGPLTSVRRLLGVQSQGRVPFARDWYVLGGASAFLRNDASAGIANISTGGPDTTAVPRFQASERTPQ